jgi:beta-glucosidase
LIHRSLFPRVLFSASTLFVAGLILSGVAAAQQPSPTERPWMNAKLSAEKRAELVLGQLTLDEKISLLHGEGMRDWANMSPAILAVQGRSNGGAGFVFGVPRLGIPEIQMSDAAYGVRSSAANGRYSTALPSNLASAASWDPQASCEYGALIGRELRAQGYNMTLGGGVNITREPRNGRTFEYMGEDPVLAGTMVGNRIRCEGEQHVISDIKHYAVNDQESGRNNVDSRISERALRESDLLAFQIGVRVGHPNAVMCSYNGVNGDYACQNKFLLHDVLKGEWKFPGFVVSDWGATHSTEEASAAGLDNEEPLDRYFGDPLKKAVEAGRVAMDELNDHVRRVLYGEFASGIIDHPMKKGVIDVQGGFDISRHIAENSSVLLRNQDALLPLDGSKLRSVAVIGFNANTAMISGGGSAQVDPPGTGAPWRAKVWFPTSPLAAIRAKLAADAEVSFDSGADVAQAVAKAKTADVAVVFAWQWEAEDADLPNLALPEDQDKLIAAVAAANPHTVVVLESGTAVTMPWLDRTGAVLEAWYAGSKGADAVANLLFGDVNPSGKLPMTFPRSEADLPRAKIAQPPAGTHPGALSFKVDYTEGAAVGYKWYESQKKPVLFPFGFGLSYTTFQYSDLKVDEGSSDGKLTASLRVTNTGKRKGAEVAEIYASLPDAAGEPWKRLVGWSKVELAPGESRTVQVPIDPLYLSIWDEAGKRWNRLPGEYGMMAGGSSADLPLHTTVTLK